MWQETKRGRDDSFGRVLGNPECGPWDDATGFARSSRARGMPASRSQAKSQSELLGVAHSQQRSGSPEEDGRPAPAAHQQNYTKQQQEQQEPQQQQPPQQQQEEGGERAMSSDIRSSASSLRSDSSKRKHPDRSPATTTTTTTTTTSTDPASASASASASAASSKRYRQDRFCYTSLSTLSSSLTQEVRSDPASSASCVEDAEEQNQLQQQEGGIMLLRGPRYRVSAKSKSSRPGSASAKRMHHQLLKLPATQEASCDALSLVDTAGGIVTKLSTVGTCCSTDATSRESEDEDVTSFDPDHQRRKGQGRGGAVARPGQGQGLGLGQGLGHGQEQEQEQGLGQGQGPGPVPGPLPLPLALPTTGNNNSNNNGLSQLLGSKRRKFDPFETCHAEAELAAVMKRRNPQQGDDVVLHDTHAAALTSSKTEDGGGYYRAQADVSSSTTSAGQDDQTAPAPVFVLSSGRISKGEEARLGKRPPTVDDEFDQYFSQLIL